MFTKFKSKKIKDFVSKPSLKEKGDRLRWMSPRDSEIVRKPLAIVESERLLKLNKNNYLGGMKLIITAEVFRVTIL